VPEAVLGVPARGAWNLHPGPLPRYAGLNAPSWAIYRGEQRHGVTVHRMDRGIDTGDIAYQETRKVALTGERCVAPPGTVRGEQVACGDEWLQLVYQRSLPKMRSGTSSTSSGTKTSSAVTADTAARNGSDSRV